MPQDRVTKLITTAIHRLASAERNVLTVRAALANQMISQQSDQLLSVLADREAEMERARAALETLRRTPRWQIERDLAGEISDAKTPDHSE